MAGIMTDSTGDRTGPAAERCLDTTGHRCPIPVLRTEAALRGLAFQGTQPLGGALAEQGWGAPPPQQQGWGAPPPQQGWGAPPPMAPQRPAGGPQGRGRGTTLPAWMTAQNQ